MADKVIYWDMDATALLFDKLGIRVGMDDGGNLIVRATYQNPMDNTMSKAMYGWNKISFDRASSMDVLRSIKSIIDEVEKYAP